jgi:hypothetical protein
MNSSQRSSAGAPPVSWEEIMYLMAVDGDLASGARSQAITAGFRIAW